MWTIVKRLLPLTKEAERTPMKCYTVMLNFLFYWLVSSLRAKIGFVFIQKVFTEHLLAVCLESIFLSHHTEHDPKVMLKILLTACKEGLPYTGVLALPTYY